MDMTFFNCYLNIHQMGSEREINPILISLFNFKKSTSNPKNNKLHLLLLFEFKGS